VTIGRHVPGSVGHALVDAARQAFISGADRALLVAVGAALLGALAAARFLPARPTTDAVDEVPADESWAFGEVGVPSAIGSGPLDPVGIAEVSLVS
jgi:hypothetical protein